MEFLQRRALLMVVKMAERVEIEFELAIDRLWPTLRTEHLHGLGMRHFAQRIDRQRLLTMRQGR